MTIPLSEVVGIEDPRDQQQRIPISEVAEMTDSSEGELVPYTEVGQIEDDPTPLEALKVGSKALAEDPDFDPAAFFVQNESLIGPDELATLGEVLKEKKLTAGGVVKAAGEAAVAAYTAIPGVLAEVGDVAVQAGKQALAFKGGLGVLDSTKKKVAEVVSATEVNAASYAKLGKGLVEKLGDAAAEDPLAALLIGKTPELTPEDWQQRLLTRAELMRAETAAGQGAGSATELLGMTPEDLAKEGIVLDPQSIQDLTWVADPLILTAAGKGFAVTAGGRQIATAATKGAAAKLVDAAKSAVTKTAGRAISRVGKTVRRAGEVASSDSGRIASTAAGYLVGDLTGAATGVAAPGAAKRAGLVMEKAGEMVQGTRPIPRGVRTISKVLGSDLVKAPVRAFNPAENPVAAGLAAGGRTDQEVGGVAGSVAAFSTLGAAVGGAKKVAKAGAEFAADKAALARFKEIDRAPVAPFDYGIDPTLDAAHRQMTSVLAQADPKGANRLNYFRAALPDGVELYVLPPDEFSKRVGAAIGVEGKYAEPGFWEKTPTGARVYLNSNTMALGHEVGHALDALMPQEARQGLRDALKDAYTPEEIQQFGAFYDSLLQGEGAKEVQLGTNQDRILNEMAAEVMSKVLNSEDLSGIPPSAQNKAVKFLTSLAEDLGLYEGKTGAEAAEGGSALGVKPSAKVADAAEAGIKPILNTGRLAAKTVLAQGPEGKGTPAPKAPNLRVTPEEQAGADIKKEVPGAAEAEKVIGANPNLYTPETAQIFSDINKSLQRPQGEVPPLRLDYQSVKAGAGATEAQIRKLEQDEAYVRETLGALPQDVRQLVDKMTIPYRWTTRGDNVNLLAYSPDKMLANGRKIVESVKGKPGAEALVPYETADGKFTEQGWRDYLADLQIYTKNQANGFGGDGSKVTRPPGYDGVIPDENPTYTPVPLDKTKADFVNLAMALPPPKTARTPAGMKGALPEKFPNVQAAALAEANTRPVIRPAATATPGKDVYTQEGGNVPIAETNPLRDALAGEGVDLTGRALFQAVEELNLQDIKGVKAEPQSGFRAPNTDLIRAGFMPDTSRAKPVNEDVRALADEYNKTAGIAKPAFREYEPVREDRAKALADAYDAAKHSPDDPAVQEAYGAMASEVEAQWDAITKAGYQLKPWLKEGQPYKTSAEMAADVKNNKQLYFFLTEGGYGSDAAGVPIKHPLLAETKVTVDGKKLLVNDLFRAVHDFFGHAKEGYEFGPRGEYNAYLAHSRMFSDPAVQALASETLGQNSWVNYGKHLRRPDGSIPERGDADYVKPADRPFADQKAFLLPPEMVREATPGLEAPERGFMPDTEERDKLTKLFGYPPIKDLSKQTFGRGTYVVSPGGNVFFEQMGLSGVKDITGSSEGWVFIENDGYAGSPLQIDGTPSPEQSSILQEYSNSTNKRAVRAGNIQETVLAPQKVVKQDVKGLKKGLFKEATGADNGLPQQGFILPDGRQLVMSTELRYHDDIVDGDLFEGSVKNGNSAAFVGSTGSIRVSQPLSLRQLSDYGGHLGLSLSESHGASDAAVKQVMKLVNGDYEWQSIGVDFVDSSGRTTGGKIFGPGQKGDLIRFLKSNNKSEAGFMPTMAEYEARKAAEKAQPEVVRRAAPKGGISIPEGLQLKRKTALPAAVGEDLRLIRYSSRAGEELADPKFFGKGAATPTDLRGLPKTFWFEEGSKTGADATVVASSGKTVYGARVNGKGIYDALGEDPLNWAGAVNREKADRAVMDAGYSGVRTRSADGRDIVTLFDVVRQTELGLVEKPQKRAVNPGDVSFMPDPQRAAKKLANERIKTVKETYPEAVVPEYLTTPEGEYKLDKKTGLPIIRKVAYSLFRSPLLERSKKSPEKVITTVADRMEAEYNKAIENPEVAAGREWYSLARTKLKNLLGDDSGFFAQLLGATSAQTPVLDNFAQSVDAYNQYKSGKYDRIIQEYLRGQELYRSGELGRMFAEATGKENPNRNVQLKWWVEKNDLTPFRGNGKRYNANSLPVLRVLAGTWLEETKGPKTPNFAGNLSGASTKATIDVWAARNLRRHIYEGEKRWRILPEQEQGVSDPDFFFGQSIYEELAKRTGTQADSLQAIFWFQEKDLWEKNGWTSSVGAEKSDFNTLLNVTTKKGEGLDFTKPKGAKETPQEEMNFDDTEND